MDAPVNPSGQQAGPPDNKQLQQILAGQASGRRIITEGTWHGWVFSLETRDWKRVACGDSLGEASHRLGVVSRELGIADKFCCLTRGAPPSWCPADR